MKNLLYLFISFAFLVSCSNNEEKEKEEISEVFENTFENIEKEAKDSIKIPETIIKHSYLKEGELTKLKEK
ncbi:MAG: hypothetical protein DRI95_14670, partial [Bacteroidetes bacterium]